MHIIPYSQGSAEWLEWKSTVVGASELAICLGLSPYQTAKQLFYHKTGLTPPPDLSRNPHIIRGKKLEPHARLTTENYFSKKLNQHCLLMPVVAISDEKSLIGASFDGINLLPDHPMFNIPVELKCPGLTVWNDIQRRGRLSTHYIMYAIQVQQQIYVAGAKEGYLVFYYQKNIKVFHIKRDDQFLGYAIPIAENFMRNVLKITPPADDTERDIFSPTEDSEITAWQQLRDDYEQNVQQLNAAPNDTTLLQKRNQLRDKAVELLGLYRCGQIGSFRISRTRPTSKPNHQEQLTQLLDYIHQHNINIPEAILNTDNFVNTTESQLRVTTKAKPLTQPQIPSNPNVIKGFEIEFTPTT
ncbi:lambda-exonuclease family protein [Photobacterium sp. GB-72]|uniref:lambda-exonuclease family protein n=1 Tax=Photobacterium sp. GB-72 TaxID=2022105 RepID=UPI000D159EE7|nr:YqaJ viral recombinase family protein [Photobacterium sp. GB-72]PSV28103.1 hypothetical protein C9J40_19680 [Photobacterium sp. GB-72]